MRGELMCGFARLARTDRIAQTVLKKKTSLLRGCCFWVRLPGHPAGACSGPFAQGREANP